MTRCSSGPSSAAGSWPLGHPHPRPGHPGLQGAQSQRPGRSRASLPGARVATRPGPGERWLGGRFSRPLPHLIQHCPEMPRISPASPRLTWRCVPAGRGSLTARVEMSRSPRDSYRAAAAAEEAEPGEAATAVQLRIPPC